MKIRMKLLLGFGLVIVMVVAMGAIAIFDLIFVETTFSYAIDHPIGGRRAIQEVQSDFRELRRAVSAMGMYSPDAASDQTEKLYAEAMVAYADALVNIADYVNNVEANESYAEVDKGSRLDGVRQVESLIQRYKEEVCDPVREAALVNDYEKCVEIIGAAANSIASQITNIVSELVESASATATTSVATAEKTASETVILLAVIASATIVVAIILALLIASFVSRPIRRMVDVAENLANGNLTVNIDTSTKDETGMLARAFSRLVGVINELLDEIHKLEHAFNVEGDIDARLDPTHFQGSYREVMDSMNNFATGIVDDTLVMLHILIDFSEGNFSTEIPAMPGKKIILKETGEKFKATIHAINSQLRDIAKDVVDGNVKSRVDVDAFKGEWSALMVGVNGLMDAIATPAAEIIDVMQYVSQGHFDRQMVGEYKGGFLNLKNAVNTTITNVASYIEEISRVLLALSQNNLDQEITREYVGEFTIIKDAMNNIIHTFNNVVGDMTFAAEQVATGAKAISESSMMLATGATEQASSVQELNATVTVINEKTTHNANSAKDAETLSQSSEENASQGDSYMKDMLVAMDGIKDSSGKISRIIQVIEDIAFQTNLLALNASVEAARAGEQGRGFAVVAQEVRMLASRSQTAAKETAVLIEESISRVDEGMMIADKTAGSLRTIVDDIGTIAQIITNITISSEEQAEAVSQVVQGLDQITSVVQDNSATSEESASAAQQLSSQAEVMHSLVRVFKLKKK